ncbi:bifunctional folylpolyglutamate synthase/dihydrofolate synthase [Gracilibacillus salitolerans]|uniref:tetrahydrofolate synthase n=1 Tax=Gracilibacillus salitolerans TaxID=2663022 RepID=A0A5Q2TM72_9BACI|nr:folylpolyglutamate synthase/dihydrofolate synthase family protein [Gracilibacillus salitolerans]QGH35182.1 bifunctional folylpolyglutamate synthase/dihydrofolate synthase [Gracilibacillus salitolerans]
MMESVRDLEHFFASRRTLGIKPGLERLDYLLEQVNHPQKSIPTIHIAGTNGKGSTLTYLKEVLMESGYTVGTFQSPGLPSILDHIAINNQSITTQEFIDILHPLLPIIEEMDHQNLAPSEYEILMVITFLFLQDNIDIAVIETAMGGREDVTNRVEPLLTIITTIAFDHTSFLGNTLKDIAAHKAGIIKEKVPVISGDLVDEALQVVKEEARKQSAPLYLYGKEFWTEEIDRNLFRWNNGSKSYVIDLSMKGRHQIMNASLAIQALDLLQDKGFTIDAIAMKKALYRAKLANRMEIIKENPMIIADGAHNVQSVHKLVETIQEENIEGRVKVLFSAFRDKEIAMMIMELSKLTDEIVVTTFNHPRALSESEIPNHIFYIEDAKQALDKLLVSSNLNDLIVITGSLHFVESAKRLVQK